MRARQRHLNAKAANASLVLDARYITGRSNYSYLKTWSDRSGNGYDMTTVFDSQAPFYVVNSINGLPSTEWDQSNDYLQNANPFDWTGLVVVFRPTGTSGSLGFCGAVPSNGLPDAAYYCSCEGAGLTVGFTRVSSTRTYLGAGAGPVTFGSPSIFSLSRSTTAVKTAANGVYGTESTAATFTPSTIIGPSYIGCGNYSNYRTNFFKGNIAIFIGIQGSRPSDSIMKRLEHFAAYSYKIACS